jgi:transposase InsO family protein
MADKPKKMSIPPEYRLRVKQRLAIVTYAVEHGLLPASRRFSLDRKTIREWRDRWREHALLGLVPRYPERRQSRVPDDVLRLLEHARRELGYGAPRTRIWLRRVHKRELPAATIQRAFVRLGLPRLPGKRPRAMRPKQLRLFEKPEPGDSVQVDVKVVKVNGRRAYQYTAIDDCTRFRVLRLYREQNQRASIDFFAEVRRALPFGIRRLQCDNGTEFSLAFALTVQEAGIKLRYIRPRCPQQNGKVERSHRIDNEEFWRRHRFVAFDEAGRALAGWERIYNYERFSMALHGATPVEKLRRLLPGLSVA